jgi:fructose-bisphosphate aldolase, class II
MLIPQHELLTDARKGGYALGSFDVLSVESALGVIDAAEQARSPVVLAISNTHLGQLNFDVLAPAVLAAARGAAVPVVTHLDHASSLGLVARALRLGFTSVMYDGSGEPWDQHLAETRVVVAMAHELGAHVEAALSEQSRAATSNPTGAWELPSAELAAEFIDATGVDVLAIGEGRSDFDPDKVRAIAAIPGIFAVLHGGSGLPDRAIAELINAGVVKCSVFTKIAASGLDFAARYASGDGTTLLGLGTQIRSGYAAAVAAQLERFGSVGRA